jgi:hypothetical protein
MCDNWLDCDQQTKRSNLTCPHVQVFAFSFEMSSANFNDIPSINNSRNAFTCFRCETCGRTERQRDKPMLSHHAFTLCNLWWELTKRTNLPGCIRKGSHLPHAIKMQLFLPVNFGYEGRKLNTVSFTTLSTNSPIYTVTRRGDFAWLISRVLDWMIGFIAPYTFTAQDYR